MARSITSALTINVLPGVTSSVNFHGGEGPATLTYHGTGSAVLVAGDENSDLEGGLGPSRLSGGDGDDTITLGHGTNIVSGGGGHNTIFVDAPISGDGTIDAGTNPGNSLVLLSDANTQNISTTTSGTQMDLAITSVGGGAPVHLLASHIGDIVVNAVNRAANMSFGDLSPIGVTQIVIDAKTSKNTGRQFTLDAGANLAASDIDMDAIDATDSPSPADIEHGANIVNHTTGTSVQLFGLAGDDVFTLQQHGGALNVQALGFTSGKFVIDDSARLPNAAQSIQIFTPIQDNGIALNATDDGGGLSIATAQYSTFLIRGATTLDSLALEVNVPGQAAGKNVLAIDGSSFHGSLQVDSLGDATAQDDVTLSAASLDLATTFDGHATSTLLHFATGQLAAIRYDATAENLALSIDDSIASVGSYLEMTATEFGEWVVPSNGPSPRLHYSNLAGLLSIAAGPGDRFQLDATPPSVTSMEMSNASDTLDPVYTANWAVPMTLDGDLALYLGQKLHSDGTVERVEHLTNVQTSFILNHSGSPATQVVLDAALDAPGATYSMVGVTGDGSGDPPGDLSVENSAGGLNVAIFGMRVHDELRMDLTGATVIGNLLGVVPGITSGIGPGIITFDGSDRFAGANPTAANIYQLFTPSHDMDVAPVGANQTRVNMVATLNVNVIGSMPQDVLTLNMPMILSGADYKITIDGSELRGQLNVSAVDVAPATANKPIAHEFAAAEAVPRPIDPKLSLGYSSASIFLNAVRPDLNVNLSGTTNYDSTILYQDPSLYADPSLYPDLNDWLHFAEINARNLTGAPQNNFWQLTAKASDITIGDGSLAKIQGNVFARNAAVTIDDRQGTDANIIQMTTTGFTGWATPSGSHPSVTIGTVYGAFTFNASPTDRFNIAGTPQHWWDANLAKAEPLLTDGWKVSDDGTTTIKRDASYDDYLFFPADRTVINNFATTGAPADIYITAKDMMPLSITGNFNLVAGRQLLANGTVQIGTVDNIIQPPAGSQIARQQPIAFSYTGQGTGTAIWDASQDVLTSAFISSMKGSTFYGVFASPLNPGLATLYYLDGDYVMTRDFADSNLFPTGNGTIDVRGQLVYGNNTDLTFFAPQLPSGTTFSQIFDNPLSTSAVHYYSNSADSPGTTEQVSIYSTRGLVDVHGTPQVTRVFVSPPPQGFFVTTNDNGPLLSEHTSTINVVPYLPVDSYLTDSILGDISVTSATLQIEANAQTTPPAPPVIPPVVLTQTELTGLTGGTIRMSNLSNYFVTNSSSNSGGQPEAGSQNAGLYIDLPSYGTINTTVDDTPPGAITVLTAMATNPHPVTVLGTTGGLVFGTRLNGPTIAIGNGSLDNIKGSLYFLTPIGDVAKTFDGHLDTPRTVTATALVGNQTEVNPVYTAKMTGLTPATIYFDSLISHVDILGSAGSTYNMYYAGNDTNAWRLFTGPATTVNVFPWPASTALFTITPNLEIYGPQTVNVTINNTIFGTSSGIPLKVYKDPSRPTDPIALNVDVSGSTTATSPFSSVILERFDATEGDFAHGPRHARDHAASYLSVGRHAPESGHGRHEHVQNDHCERHARRGCRDRPRPCDGHCGEYHGTAHDSARGNVSRPSHDYACRQPADACRPDYDLGHR